MTLNAIKKAIEQKNALWTPKVSIVSELTESQKKMLLGLNKPEGLETAEKAIPGISVAYPEKWDWRDASVGNIHGDFTTAIRDQSGCGSCVAHATCAMIECTYDVFKGDPGKNLDLSEQDLFSHGGNCNTGWTFVPAMNTAKNGIPDEACWPYLSGNAPCSDRKNRLTKIVTWTQLRSVDEVKTYIAMNGGVMTGMHVYEDFFYYDSGIYSASYGGYVGDHAVCIVGFNDAQRYWICKNSWSTEWGESGWFRISYDSGCGFGGSFGFYGVSFGQDDQKEFYIKIEVPVSGSSYAPGQSISVAMTAKDTLGTITKVELYLDNVLIAEDLEEPWMISFSTTNLGAHFIKAKAYDDKGNSVMSSNIPIVVQKPVPSADIIVAPKDGILTAKLISYKKPPRISSMDMVGPTPANIYKDSTFQIVPVTVANVHKGDWITFKVESDIGTLYSDRSLNPGKAQKAFILKAGSARWQVRWGVLDKKFINLVVQIDVI
jgi:hypothetical protein